MATAAPAIDTDRLVAAFVHTLRRGGLEVTVSQSALFREALEAVGLGNGLDVYWSGRSTLVTKQEHVAMYDAMFLAFFHHNTSGFQMRFDDVVQMLSDSFDGDTNADSDGNDDDEPALQLLMLPQKKPLPSYQRRADYLAPTHCRLCFDVPIAHKDGHIPGWR